MILNTTNTTQTNKPTKHMRRVASQLFSYPSIIPKSPFPPILYVCISSWFHTPGLEFLGARLEKLILTLSPACREPSDACLMLACLMLQYCTAAVQYCTVSFPPSFLPYPSIILRCVSVSNVSQEPRAKSQEGQARSSRWCSKLEVGGWRAACQCQCHTMDKMDHG